MFENFLRILVGIALDQIHQRVGANVIATMFGGDLFDATARLLLILDILASEKGRGTVLRNKLISSLRRRRANDRHIFLHGLGPRLTLLQPEVLSVLRDVIFRPKPLDD